MKKIIMMMAAALMLVGCGNKSEEKTTAQIQEEIYYQHLNDSVGLSTFKFLLTNIWSGERSIEEYAKASDLIRNDALIKTKMEAIEHAADVATGKPYVEIAGPNALSGDTLSIGDILKEGKPVLVDFWASWCSPCRKEIKEHLLQIAAQGKVNIVGIAVWEDTVDDTKETMEALGISWPVIYTGGRENSPSISYGVLGIPTLFLLSPEGTILGSAHNVTDIPAMAEYLQ